MKYVNSSRRQIAMAVLLGLAVIGGAIRHFAPNPSLARDIGTLMLVLWLPAVGNLVAFVIRKIPRPAPPPPPFANLPFTRHLVASFEPVEDAGLLASQPADLAMCTLVVGNEGFTARAEVPLARMLLAEGGAREVPLQLLRPSHAAPRLPAGTRLKYLVGNAIVATGTVGPLEA